MVNRKSIHPKRRLRSWRFDGIEVFRTEWAFLEAQVWVRKLRKPGRSHSCPCRHCSQNEQYELLRAVVELPFVL